MKNAYNIKRIVVAVCGSTTYNKITADKEISVVNEIVLNNPIKYVYDPNVRIYYEFIKANKLMEDKIGDANIVIVNTSQFGDEDFNEADMLGSIARVTNFATNVAEAPAEEVTENTESDKVIDIPKQNQ